MGYIEGLLGGFSQRRDVVEAQTREDNARAQDRENRIIEHLINSPDPEVKSHGIAAMLDSANPKPKGKGIKGWLGEVQQNPHLDTIRAIVEADRANSVAPSPAEDRQITAAPPSAEPLAQATTSPTEVGAPPPTATEPAPSVDPSLARTAEGNEEISVGTTADQPPGVAPMAVLGQAPQAAAGRKPRQIFQTPEGQARLTKKATAQGDVEGMVEGLVASGIPREEAAATVQQHMRGRYALGLTGGQSIRGEAPDAEGTFQPVFAILNKATQKYVSADPDSPYYGIEIPGFRPAPAGGLRTAGMDREAIALADYGMRYEQLAKTNPAAAQAVLAKERTIIEGKAKARGAGAGAAAFEKPIGVSEAQKTNTAVGTSSAQYSGQEIASEAEQARRRGVANVSTQLDHIKALISGGVDEAGKKVAGPLPQQNELAGLVPGAAIAIRRRSPQYRERIATLDSAIDNILASLSRTIQENRGAQTEQDAQRAYATIASLKGRLLDPASGDTQESALARITETQTYLKTILSTLPGNPVPQAVGAPPPAAGTPPAAGAPPPPGRSATPAGVNPGAGGSPTSYKDAQGNWHIRTVRESQF